MTLRRYVVLGALAVVPVMMALAGPSGAQEGGDAEKGRVYAEENCARCHAVGREDDSPLAAAPPFRTLASKYPLESLEESLAEGIVTGHANMPQFELDPPQIADLIAWLDEISR